MNEAFAVELLTIDLIVVVGNCETFVTITEAEVAVVEPEAVVRYALVFGVLKRVARAASIIVVDGAHDGEGGAVNALRG